MKFLNKPIKTMYSGLTGIGRGIRKGVDKALDSYENKLKQVDQSKEDKNMKMIEQQFGSYENYLKMQEEDKKKKKKTI